MNDEKKRGVYNNKVCIDMHQCKEPLAFTPHVINHNILISEGVSELMNRLNCHALIDYLAHVGYIRQFVQINDDDMRLTVKVVKSGSEWNLLLTFNEQLITVMLNGEITLNVIDWDGFHKKEYFNYVLSSYDIFTIDEKSFGQYYVPFELHLMREDSIDNMVKSALLLPGEWRYLVNRELEEAVSQLGY